MGKPFCCLIKITVRRCYPTQCPIVFGLGAINDNAVTIFKKNRYIRFVGVNIIYFLRDNIHFFAQYIREFHFITRYKSSKLSAGFHTAQAVYLPSNCWRNGLSCKSHNVRKIVFRAGFVQVKRRIIVKVT